MTKQNRLINLDVMPLGPVWPALHDCEVESIELTARCAMAAMQIMVRVPREIRKPDEGEIFVEITLDDALEVSIEGFGHQNVIFQTDIRIDEAEQTVQISILASFGARLQARGGHLSVRAG